MEALVVTRFRRPRQIFLWFSGQDPKDNNWLGRHFPFG